MMFSGRMFRKLGPALRHAERLSALRNAQIRACSSSTSPTFRLLEDSLELNYRGAPMLFNYVWLRDHCRSASSFNTATNQRNVDTGSIDLSIRPVRTNLQGDNLILTWPDGHTTEYRLDWLFENSYEKQKQTPVQRRILWNADVYNNAHVQPAKWEKFMETDDELKKFLRNYLLYGIAFVDEVPNTVEATEAVTQRASLIRETTYGKMWCFTSDFSRGDTAYSQLALDRHTDTSYFHEPCGIKTVQNPGFPLPEARGHRWTDAPGGWILRRRTAAPEVAGKLRAARSCAHPTRVHRKHRQPQEPHNGDRTRAPGVPLEQRSVHDAVNETFCPLLKLACPSLFQLFLRSTTEFLLIFSRYNNYDRSVMNTVPPDAVQRWYVAHRELTAQLRRPESELWVKLTPGKVIFIDNWRVLHGRESFTGLRQLCGCYLTRDDVLSTARCLGLEGLS